MTRRERVIWSLVLVIALSLVGVFIFQRWSATHPAAQDPVKEQQAQHRSQQFLAHGFVTVPPPSDGSNNQAPAIVSTSQVPVTNSTSTDTSSALVADQIFAVIDIPSLGVEYPVGEGVDMSLLASSVGHYPGTALPGQIGNTTYAGHDCCREHGSPFVNLYKIRVGDLVTVTTKTFVYSYHVVPMSSCGPNVPQILDYHRADVLDSVPCVGNDAPSRKLLTLTTCTPGGPNPTPWRLIVFAEQFSAVPR